MAISAQKLFDSRRKSVRRTCFEVIPLWIACVFILLGLTFIWILTKPSKLGGLAEIIPELPLPNFPNSETEFTLLHPETAIHYQLHARPWQFHGYEIYNSTVPDSCYLRAFSKLADREQIYNFTGPFPSLPRFTVSYLIWLPHATPYFTILPGHLQPSLFPLGPVLLILHLYVLFKGWMASWLLIFGNQSFWKRLLRILRNSGKLCILYFVGYLLTLAPTQNVVFPPESTFGWFNSEVALV